MMATKSGNGIQPDEDSNNPSVLPRLEVGSGESSGVPLPESSVKRYPNGGGIAIIIDNREFDSSFKNRKGSAADSDKLYSMFNTLGFEEIRYERNKSCAEIERFLEEERCKDYSGIKRFVCVILSYGQKGYIYGATGNKDDRMEIDNIIKPFKGDNCRSLIYIPKLFIFQTCPPMSKLQKDGATYQAEAEEAVDDGQVIPFESDVLLVQSCIPGDLVWSKQGMENTPSWFIDILTQSISEGNHDILSALTVVIRKLAEKIYRDNIQADLPYISSMLRNDLFFKN